MNGDPVSLYDAPCCICPPSHTDDESGDACASASCAWCLFGCPAPDDCCRDEVPA